MAKAKTAKEQLSTAPKPMKPVLDSAQSFATLVADANALVAKLNAEAVVIQEKGDAIQYARAYVVLHHLDDMLDQLRKTFNGTYEVIKKERLPGVFESAGITSIPLDEGWRVGVSQNIRASIREGMKEPAHAWLREHELGDLIVETVNASTLSAAAKAMMEDETNPRELDDAIFNVALMPTTSVTKLKPKAKE